MSMIVKEWHLWSSRSDFTTRHLLDLCDDLGREFNTVFNTTEYKFDPEPITEGGILMSSFPSKIPNSYKTMRIRFEYYPLVDVEKWKHGEPIVIVSHFQCPTIGARKTQQRSWEHFNVMGTYLKVRNAPVWSQDELSLLETCMINNGLYVVKKSNKLH